VTDRGFSFFNRQQQRGHEQRRLDGLKELFVRCLVGDVFHECIAPQQSCAFNVQN
jgi:hypothetical protein